MRLSRFVVLCIMTTWLLVVSPSAVDASELSTVMSATKFLQQVRSNIVTRIPPTVLRQSRGILVIPDVIKAGFILAGQRGQGLLLIKDATDKWTNPSFVTLTGGSVGFQAGGQSSDVVLLLLTQESINGITNNKFTLGGDAEVAAGPVGISKGAATDFGGAEILSYSRSRGVFLGVSLTGSSIEIDKNANEKYYNRKGINANDIFTDYTLIAPPEVDNFKMALLASQL